MQLFSFYRIKILVQQFFKLIKAGYAIYPSAQRGAAVHAGKVPLYMLAHFNYCAVPAAFCQPLGVVNGGGNAHGV